MRFRVRTVPDHRMVPVWRGLLRSMLKLMLGLLSFLSMPFRTDRRALHDLAAGTIVLDIRDLKS